jgi:hypothetical protein
LSDDTNTDGLAAIDKEISENVDSLIDLNAETMQMSRKHARFWVDVAEVYDSMADKARRIAELHAEGAAQLAGLTYEIVKDEWGIVEVEVDEEDDEEDEEDEG